MPERSLGFARDDVTGVALSKHIRCTLREINPFPHTVISSAERNPPCTLLFLAPFAKGFPFSAISHRAIYTIPSFRAQREIFLALRRSLLLSQKGFPVFRYHTYGDIHHTVISSAARNLPCTPSFLAPFVKAFPFSAISHRPLYQCAGKIEGFARDDDTGSTFQTYPLYAT